MGTVDVARGAGIFSADRNALLAAAEAAANSALSLAPDHAAAHFIMGLVQSFTNRASEAIPEFERALALDRNYAAAQGQIGFAKMALGRGDDISGRPLPEWPSFMF
jgi:hypothetical protein